MTNIWHEMTALDLGSQIERGEIDPVELTTAFLERIADHDPDGEIYVRTTGERALGEAQAAALRARNGTRRSPLDGVPISWKDLFDTKGIATEAGAKILEGRIPEDDAECLKRATRAGLVCLGKTNMPDVAFSGLGNNAWTGTGANPFDKTVKRVPGGSSSGAALSVVHGLAAAGIGSDTAGSVRIPSAWCGLTGLKTTHGLISLEGTVPLSPSQDTVGPLTRDVADANMITAILAGTAPADLRGATLNGTRILRATTVFNDLVDPDIQAGIDRGLEKLSRAGATIVEGPVPVFQEVLDRCAEQGTPANIEGNVLWAAMARQNPDGMFGPIARRFFAADEFSAPGIVGLYMSLKDFTRRYLQETAGFDLVVGATVPEAPPALAPLYEDEELYLKAALMSISLTRLANLLGLCATSLPAGFVGGFPIGMMLMAPPFQEGKLLRLSKAAEQALAS
ncbi:amidase [Sneathiella chinensis]|uniref:Amidase n=1 Tax=Sneathiella chinensis TaxID=349750 RepID=A0ABQ5TYG8_9PROT|nr:amidase [Sneathiella chinensis]GLQ05012.1 amidase [Sneathiella chinensis]